MHRNSDHQLFIFYPLVCEEKIVGAIEICASEDLNHEQELIDSLIQVYGNCLFHINKSERDKLTGLLNRHSFETKFKRLIATQQAKQRSAFEQKTAYEHRVFNPDSFAWLAIFDIDHFKRVNDQFGHVCGDEVLLKLSQKMKSFFRSSDLLFRFGGEEFVVILEPIPHEMAQRTLERFREKVEESVFPLVENITTSGGYIKITDADYPAVFIERADQALYHAKSSGRNKICNYELLVDSGELPKPKEIGGVDLF
ncbi:MAG: GGDEF domain-containing protein [Nitrosomonas sp.]|nr:GGDEF domain-containing protein [Nitrosomonas sp.]